MHAYFFRMGGLLTFEDCIIGATKKDKRQGRTKLGVRETNGGWTVPRFSLRSQGGSNPIRGGDNL